MTEIEEKALALVNKVRAENRGFTSAARPHLRHADMEELEAALCRAIEHHEADKAAHAATVEGILKAHEAYKQDVSDAVEHCRACSDPEAWTRIKFELERFIISKPDPLAEVLDQLNVGNGWDDTEDYARRVYEALAKRGLKIVETGQ